MITDDFFTVMQKAKPEEIKSFIPRFLEYIKDSSYNDKLKLAIEKKDPSILINILHSIPTEKLDKELPYIIATGRFIYLLKLWNY